VAKRFVKISPIFPTNSCLRWTTSHLFSMIARVEMFYSAVAWAVRFLTSSSLVSLDDLDCTSPLHRRIDEIAGQPVSTALPLVDGAAGYVAGPLAL